ncbi:MAG: class I SAM-dependent methyltransferase [Vicinamibacterales bacterium]
MAADARGAAVRAFDLVADDYDRLADGALFLAQRARARAALVEWLPARSRVLEIGCGTGLDAVFLAEAGMDVVACDPSSEMQRLTAGRALRAGVVDRVRVLDCGLEGLPAFLDALGAEFDAIVSNFGALNCVASLDALGVVAAGHLRPGGAALLTVMGRACLLEMAYFALTRRPAQALRRRQDHVMVPVGGIDVPTYYHSLEALGRALGPDLMRAQVRGLGVLLPPPYLEPRWRALPPAVRAAARAADRVVASWPGLNRCGDHVLARWVKRRYGRG